MIVYSAGRDGLFKEDWMATPSPRTFIANLGAEEFWKRTVRERLTTPAHLMIHIASDCVDFVRIRALYLIEPRQGLWSGAPCFALRTPHGFDIPAYYYDHALRHALAHESLRLRISDMFAVLRAQYHGAMLEPCLFCGKLHGIAWNRESLVPALELFVRAARWVVKSASAPKLIATLSSAEMQRFICHSGVTATMRGIRIKEQNGSVHHFFGDMDDETLLAGAVVILRSPDIRAFELECLRREMLVRGTAFRERNAP